MARAFLVLVCGLMGLGLAGCNFVVSEKPLFHAADAAGAPPLRTGIWYSPDKDCADFDPAKPLAEWPECGNGGVVRADVLADPKKPDASIPYVLAAGDPRVMQVGIVNDKGDKTVYIYQGIRPTKTDDQGRVIEFESWFALCGPPPPANDPIIKPGHEPDTKALVTKHPLPGLKIDDKTGMCMATEQGPVRASVAASRAWASADDLARRVRWLRDGET